MNVNNNYKYFNIKIEKIKQKMFNYRPQKRMFFNQSNQRTNNDSSLTVWDTSADNVSIKKSDYQLNYSLTP